MAVVYSPKVIEIAVIQEYMGRPVVNVWHIYHDVEGFGPDSEAIVRDFANNWQDHILDSQVLALELVRFDWRSLDPTDSTVGVLTPDPAKATTGQEPGNGTPPNVAVLVNKRTSDRPRGARDGRCFLAAFDEGNIDQRGLILTAAYNTWQTRLDNFYNGISDTSLDWSGDRYPVVLETTAASRAPGSDSVVINSRRVTSLPLDPLVSTQRDRLR